jgi:hypothetical protein
VASGSGDGALLSPDDIVLDALYLGLRAVRCERELDRGYPNPDAAAGMGDEELVVALWKVADCPRRARQGRRLHADRRDA